MKDICAEDLNAISVGFLPALVPAATWLVGAAGPWIISGALFGLGTLFFKGNPPTVEEMTMHGFNYTPSRSIEDFDSLPEERKRDLLSHRIW